jgi:hypothetical protein
MDTKAPEFPYGTNLTQPFLKKVSEKMRGWHEPLWKDEISPDGDPWLPRRMKPPGDWPILRKTGLMQDSTVFKSQGNSLLADIQDYGVKHQKGLDGMVVREWLGIPDTSLSELEDLLIDTIIEESTYA